MPKSDAAVLKSGQPKGGRRRVKAYEGVGVGAFVRLNAEEFLARLRAKDLKAWEAVMLEVVFPKLKTKMLSELMSQMKMVKEDFGATLYEKMVGKSRGIDKIRSPQGVVGYFKKTVRGYVLDAHKKFVDKRFAELPSGDDGQYELPAGHGGGRSDSRISEKAKREFRQYLGELGRKRVMPAHNRALVLAMEAGGAKPAFIAEFSDVEEQEIYDRKMIGGRGFLLWRARKEKKAKFNSLCRKVGRRV